MCLGIPGRVVEIVDGYAGPARAGRRRGRRAPGQRRHARGRRRARGDWVLIHMGFAVEVIDEAGAARGACPGWS